MKTSRSGLVVLGAGGSGRPGEGPVGPSARTPAPLPKAPDGGRASSS